jgi:hypothetical protein
MSALCGGISSTGGDGIVALTMEDLIVAADPRHRCNRDPVDCKRGCLNTAALSEYEGRLASRPFSLIKFNQMQFCANLPRCTPHVRVGSRAAVAGRRMAQPVYSQLRKYPCVSALTLRANSDIIACHQLGSCDTV